MTDPAPLRRLDGLLLAALALPWALYQLPWLDRPFGLHEVNAGNYFGVFARNYAEHGWLELRGMPVGPTLVDALPGSLPYTNHPPGFAWLVGLWGVAEWQIRLPTAVAHLAAVWLFYLLARRRFAPRAVFAASLVMLGFPALAFFSQVSYEAVVIPAGVGLWLLVTAPPPWPRRRLGGIVAICAGGIFLDWQFAFFVLGAVLMRFRWPLGAWVRSTWWLAAALLAGTGLVLAWRTWAYAAPGMPEPGDGGGLGATFSQVLFAFPPLHSWLRDVGYRWSESFSVPVLAAAAAGCWFACRRWPAAAAATLVTGLCNPLAMPTHSASHTLFHSALAPFLGLCLAALAARHRLLAFAVTLLAAWPWYWAVHDLRASRTTFFRDVGRVVSAAAAGPPRAIVGHDFPYLYAYYVDSTDVILQPLRDPAFLRAGAAGAQPGVDVEFLHLRVSGSLTELLPGLRSEAMDLFVAGYPRQRITALEVELVLPPYDRTLRIEEAWLVTLRGH